MRWQSTCRLLPTPGQMVAKYRTLSQRLRPQVLEYIVKCAVPHGIVGHGEVDFLTNGDALNEDTSRVFFSRRWWRYWWEEPLSHSNMSIPQQKQRIAVCLVTPPFRQHVYSHVSCCVFGLLNLTDSVTGAAQESHFIRNHGERWPSQAIFVLVALRFQRAGGRIPRVLQEGHALQFEDVGCLYSWSLCVLPDLALDQLHAVG